MPDYSHKKIIFADVDDTVCPSTQPVQAGMAAELNRLIASGRTLAFISGSTVQQIGEQLGQALRGDYHLLGASGTAYARVKAGQREELYHFSLEAAERRELVAAFKALAARHGLQSHTSEEDQIQDRGSQVTFSALGRHAPEGLKRAFDPKGSLRSAWAEELKKVLGPSYSVRLGGTTSLDVTKAGLDKGWGLREFLKFHGFQAQDAVFFGDKLQPGGNDYPARAVMDCVEVLSLDDALQKLKQIS